MRIVNHRTLKMNNGKMVTVVKTEDKGKLFTTLLTKCCVIQVYEPLPRIVDYSFFGEDFIDFLVTNRIDGFVHIAEVAIPAERLEHYKILDELDKEVLDELGIK